MADPHPVSVKQPRWRFCRIQNEETGKLMPVYLDDRFAERGKRLRWKNQTWIVRYSRQKSPTPFLAW
jgi:hypothetical protein